MILKSFPIIDAHCHPFNPLKEGNEDLRFDFNLYHGGASLATVRDTILSNKIILELGKLLNLGENATSDEVISTRNDLYKNNPKDYIYKLFSAVNLDTLIVDTGYPDIEFGVDSVKLEDFKELVPCKVYEIFRLEPLIFKIFSELSNTFNKIINILEMEMDKAIKRKVVGFKTVIAYETGLEIGIYKKEDAKKAYNNFRKNKSKLDEKILRDFFVLMALEKCRESDIPIQFHTGMGSIPILDLNKSNPLIMQDFLNKKEVMKTKIILTHAGHPFSRETGMLVGSFPNLYCDVSAICSYFGASALKSSFLKLFELAPINKILFGTDGGTIPETYWFGSLQGVKDMGLAFEEMIKMEWLTAKKAESFAKMILNNNSKNLFKINNNC